MSENPLEHAREQYQGAKQELEQREWDLVFQLQMQIYEEIETVDAILVGTLELVREIPERLSLDENRARLESMKKLQNIRRELKDFRTEINNLRGLDE